MKLLIVDDSNVMRRVIEKFLQQFNLDLVGTAGDGLKALEMVKAHKPDLITLDITMPLMDGLSCLEQIMVINPDAKVIVISALKDQATALQAIKKGASAFLPKPFTQEELCEEIQNCL